MRRVVVAVLATALLVAGCSSKDDGKKESSTRTTDGQTTTPSTGVQSPYTGLLAGGNLLRPALVVKIDNYAEKSYPQFGIGAADIVLCEGVEGGITRLAAIFHSQDAPKVGPVRSARSSDLHFAVPLGSPLFAYSGTNGNFEELINRSSLVNLSPNKLPGAYRRESGRPAPYNLFSSTAELFGTRRGDAPPKPLLAINSNATAEGSPVGKLTLFWKMPDRPTRTDVTWTFNGVAASRVQNGKDTVDANGPKVAPRNIVVLFVEYPDTGERDQSNSIVPEAKLEGIGEAWVIRDGKLTKGRWEKPGDESPIKLVDPNGKSIDLLPGQTWIELPAPGNATVA